MFDKSPQRPCSSNCDSYMIDERKKLFELERQVSYLMSDNTNLHDQKEKMELSHNKEIANLKDKLEQEKEEMK